MVLAVQKTNAIGCQITPSKLSGKGEFGVAFIVDRDFKANAANRLYTYR